MPELKITRDVIQLEIRILRRRGVGMDKVLEAIDNAIEPLFVEGFEGIVEAAESTVRALKEEVYRG